MDHQEIFTKSYRRNHIHVHVFINCNQKLIFFFSGGHCTLNAGRELAILVFSKLIMIKKIEHDKTEVV